MLLLGQAAASSLWLGEWTPSVSCSTRWQVPPWEQEAELIRVLMGCSTFPLLRAGVEPMLPPQTKGEVAKSTVTHPLSVYKEL